MRRIYNKYFYIPEQGKDIVREKVFFARIILSFVCILGCLFAVGYNAYAYFTVSAVSGSNLIQSARYSFDSSPNTIVVVSTNGSVSAGTNDGEYRLEPGTYDFVLSSNADDISGYGRIDVLCGEQRTSFYTRQIVQGKPCTIRIVAEAATDIQVIACWGTYSSPENVIAEYENESNNPAQMIYVDAQLQAGKVAWSMPTSVIATEEDTEQEQPIQESNTDNTNEENALAGEAEGAATEEDIQEQETEVVQEQGLQEQQEEVSE